MTDTPPAAPAAVASPAAPAALNSTEVSPQMALAAIASAEKILAQHRLQPLQALADKIKAAALGEIAADIRALMPFFTSAQDKALFDNAANVLGDVERLVTTTAAANVQAAG